MILGHEKTKLSPGFMKILVVQQGGRIPTAGRALLEETRWDLENAMDALSVGMSMDSVFLCIAQQGGSLSNRDLPRASPQPVALFLAQR